jgi:UDP-N-acetylglucosamine 4,6-dehydratase
MSSRLLDRLASLHRDTKRRILVFVDVIAMLVALQLAFLTRYGSLRFPEDPWLAPIVVICVSVGIMMLYALGIYHSVMRYLEARHIRPIAIAAAVVASMWTFMLYLGKLYEIPRSVALLWFGYMVLCWFGNRYVIASIFNHGMARTRRSAERQPVLIYGANSDGLALAQALDASSHHRAVAFVDGDAALWGQRLNGIEIYRPAEIPTLVERHGLSEVCLALRSANRRDRLEVIGRLTALNLKVMTIPSAGELLSGRFTVSEIRPIRVADLLSREVVSPQRDLIEAAIRGHSILVTGAAGSIGSEICRQLLVERPAVLVLLDHSEFGLFAISQELTQLLAAMPIEARPRLVPVLGSILDAQLLSDIVAANRVDTLYHAAAYKHVPLLESNEVVGVENNVLGTRTLVQLAQTSKLARFVMVSTDKAVRPTSVMGATKRAAEMIVQAAAARPANRTRFGIVRFGNVLDSSGSVLQLFRSQISEGGPVTVTHRDVTRFFMSIPEATQLVLQASAMAADGEVFVLDMGESVKIYDLAVNMIRLSGFSVRDGNNPDGDIAIEFVGLRPGEKLYEELFVGGNTERTSHPRIYKAAESFIQPALLEAEIGRLAAALEARDAGAVRTALKDLIARDCTYEMVADRRAAS